MYTVDTNEIVRRLHRKRATVSDMADSLGLSALYVFRVITGEEPDADTAQKVLNFLGMKNTYIKQEIYGPVEHPVFDQLIGPEDWQ